MSTNVTSIKGDMREGRNVAFHAEVNTLEFNVSTISAGGVWRCLEVSEDFWRCLNVSECV